MLKDRRRGVKCHDFPVSVNASFQMYSWMKERGSIGKRKSQDLEAFLPRSRFSEFLSSLYWYHWRWRLIKNENHILESLSLKSWIINFRSTSTLLRKTYFGCLFDLWHDYIIKVIYIIVIAPDKNEFKVSSLTTIYLHFLLDIS